MDALTSGIVNFAVKQATLDSQIQYAVAQDAGQAAMQG